MKKHLIPTAILVAYIGLLIKVMVFKDIPLIRVGQLMLNFGGANAGHAANFVPFKTILPYLFGYKGLIIAGINLVGNIILLVPMGFIVPFVFRNITWRRSLALAVASGLAIEVAQVIMHVGIFDIDDVILNALGFMIGYWVFTMRPRNRIITAVIAIVAAVAVFYAVYPSGEPSVNPGARESETPEGSDLCGGTGGIGEIVSTGTSTITIKRKDGKNQVVTFTDLATIKTSDASATIGSGLKIGDRVTLVGDANPDGSFRADTILVCSASDQKDQ